jgi:hypothetical protein
LGLSRQIGQINSGAFGVFSAKLSAPILVQFMFSINQTLLLQKNQAFISKFQISILDWDLNLGSKELAI